MYRTRSVFTLFIGVAAMVLAGAGPLFAASHTWVSGVGDDANPCTRTAPCLSFAGALAKTSPGGVISALDQGDFGPVTITQSVTIDGGGTQATVSASATGVTVDAGASDTVILRGLHIEGEGKGQTGVDFQAGGSLYIEKCAISNFTTYGISFQPSQVSQLNVSDTTIDNSANAVTSPVPAGIYLAPLGTSNCGATIDNSTVQGYTDGLLVEPYVSASVAGSTISGNSGKGIEIQGKSSVSTDNCLIANNGDAGISSHGTGAVAMMNNDTIVNNGSGLNHANNGLIYSTKTSMVYGNSGHNGSPTSALTKK